MHMKLCPLHYLNHYSQQLKNIWSVWGMVPLLFTLLQLAVTLNFLPYITDNIYK